MPALIVLLLTIAALIAARRARKRPPARALIISPRQSTTVAKGGGVRSVQSVELGVSLGDLERLWSPTNLENLGATYWRFLTKVTLGMIRVIYGEHSRSVVLMTKPLTLLRFEPPEYTLEPDHGKILWRIRDGLLVARDGRGSGYLALDVRRETSSAQSNGQAKLRIEVEVANFYPAIAVGFSMPVYEATQSSIHVLVTQAFLRSLATLKLEESRVGRLAALEQAAQDAGSQQPEQPPQP